MSQNWKLLAGDTFALLPTLATGSFDSIVTDPPYGIRFMGNAWDGAEIEARAAKRVKPNHRDSRERSGSMHAGQYDRSTAANHAFQQWTHDWADAAYAALKPGGHLISFSSTRTYHRMVCGIEDAGFEIRDQLAWVFGSGFPKSHNLTGAHEGWGTALKPAWEPIVLARKPLAGTVAANVGNHGTGALHIDACRIGDAEIKTCGGSKGGSVAEFGFTAEFQGSTHIGRWPANLTHDGSPEVVALFPAEAGVASPVTGDEPSDLFGHGICSPRARVPGAFHADTGSAARFFYCAKASAADRDSGLDNFVLQPAGLKNGSGRGLSAGDPYAEVTRANTHPTVKPVALMRWLVRLVTPAGGHVLDPFTGSGSTGVACLMEGMKFTGIEREETYLKIARARLAHAEGALFQQSPTP